MHRRQYLYLHERKSNRFNPQKNIKSTANDNKEIKYASTEKIYEETISSAFVKYQHVVDFIQDPTKTGTPNESVVICCMRKANNPVEYNVTEDGPLDIKAGKKLGLKSSESCDFMSFGPIYTSLHADLYYTTRNSLIPSWNVGVVKIWILRKECDAETNRNGTTRASTLASKAWKPADELNYILTQKEHYVLLIQHPGQIIRHYGKHLHCVITAIDPIINPTGLSLSIGRRDLYTEDQYLFFSGSRQRLMYTSTQGYKQVSRDRFLAQNITVADKRKLGKDFIDRKERARKRKQKKGRIPSWKYPLRSFFCCKNNIQLKSFFSLLIPLTYIFIILRRVIVKRRLRQRKTMKQRKTRK